MYIYLYPLLVLFLQELLPSEIYLVVKLVFKLSKSSFSIRR